MPAPIEAARLKRQDAETVLWEMSDGVGALEGPAPEIGLPHHFRWITARRCRLLLEAPAARHATLRLDYRCPIAGQRAILRVNDRKTEVTGSGVIASADGLVVTNQHVVDRADKVEVTVAGRKQPYRAQMLGHDKQTDHAVLRIQPRMANLA